MKHARKRKSHTALTITGALLTAATIAAGAFILFSPAPATVEATPIEETRTAPIIDSTKDKREVEAPSGITEVSESHTANHSDDATQANDTLTPKEIKENAVVSEVSENRKNTEPVVEKKTDRVKPKVKPVEDEGTILPPLCYTRDADGKPVKCEDATEAKPVEEQVSSQCSVRTTNGFVPCFLEYDENDETSILCFYRGENGEALPCNGEGQCFVSGENGEALPCSDEEPLLPPQCFYRGENDEPVPCEE